MEETKNKKKKEKEIILDVIHGDAKQNNFMHWADMFESGKQLGKLEQFVITGNPDLKKVALIFKDALEKADRNVSFIGIRSVNGKQPKSPEVYLRPGTQSISDGHNWGLLKGLLEGLGYEVKTTEHMHVTSVEYKK